ncbi:MAG: 3-dehydroquinate synthase [Burkholderiales bacterium]
METVRVALGARSYPVHIGAGAIDAEALYRPHLPAGRVAIVTNPVVAPLYLERVKAALARAGAAPAIVILVEDGEPAKSWAALERVFDSLLAARLGRDGLLIALGGGVVGDLAGFAAAVYQRGIPFIQIPTTLLAQVDSAVGGKTAVNHPRGKNMIGAFHQPAAVIADVGALATLTERELRAGMAEVIKHGFALDAALVAWLEKNMARLLARDAAALVHVVGRSCELKAQIVTADEREGGERALLNFGHTFGHAIETGAGYGVWLHGEAVAVGMVMAAELSVRAGLLRAADAERLRRLLRQAGLPVAGPALAPERYLELMAGDKKAAGGRARYIVLREIGRAALRDDIDERWVRAAIAACVDGASAAAAQ